MNFVLLTKDEFDQLEKPLLYHEELFTGFAHTIMANISKNRYMLPNRIFEWKAEDGLCREIWLSMVSGDPSTVRGLFMDTGVLEILVYESKCLDQNCDNPDAPAMREYASNISRFSELPSDAITIQSMLEEAYAMASNITQDDLAV